MPDTEKKCITISNNLGHRIAKKLSILWLEFFKVWESELLGVGMQKSQQTGVKRWQKIKMQSSS